jgi:hypothetical protein
MKMNLKKLVGATAIAGALGMPAFVVGAGTANATTAAPLIAGPVNTVQTWPADRGHGDCDCDWGGWGGWDGGWHGDGDWNRGGWGWGWPGGWGWGGDWRR